MLCPGNCGKCAFTSDSGNAAVAIMRHSVEHACPAMHSTAPTRASTNTPCMHCSRCYKPVHQPTTGSHAPLRLGLPGCQRYVRYPHHRNSTASRTCSFRNATRSTFCTDQRQRDEKRSDILDLPHHNAAYNQLALPQQHEGGAGHLFKNPLLSAYCAIQLSHTPHVLLPCSSCLPLLPLQSRMTT